MDFNGLSSVVTNDLNLDRNLVLQINAQGSITYTYTAIPEPPSLFLVGVAGFALAAFGFRGGRRSLSYQTR